MFSIARLASSVSTSRITTGTSASPKRLRRGDGVKARDELAPFLAVVADDDWDEHALQLDRASGALTCSELEVGQPITNRDFLVDVFPSLGENKREALKIAAGFRGEQAFDSSLPEEQAMETVLTHLSRERCLELANECLELYLWDRLGSDN
jgi:hypothetical protein